MKVCVLQHSISIGDKKIPSEIYKIFLNEERACKYLYDNSIDSKQFFIFELEVEII